MRGGFYSWIARDDEGKSLLAHSSGRFHGSTIMKKPLVNQIAFSRVDGQGKPARPCGSTKLCTIRPQSKLQISGES